MEKLEILEQFLKKYGTDINPELASVRYCQSADIAMVELSFKSNRKPIQINLDFIAGNSIENAECTDKLSSPLFNPQADIVDNARLLLNLDDYSLIMCIDYLFTEEAITRINDEYLYNMDQ